MTPLIRKANKYRIYPMPESAWTYRESRRTVRGIAWAGVLSVGAWAVIAAVANLVFICLASK